MPTTTPKKQKLSLNSISYIVQFVPDVKKTTVFYRDSLGMKVRSDNEHWTELETKNGITYALHHYDAQKHPSTEIVFGVEDVLGAREALRAQGVAVEEPKVVCEFDGKVGLSVLFKDPAGNQLSVFGFVSKQQWDKR